VFTSQYFDLPRQQSFPGVPEKLNLLRAKIGGQNVMQLPKRFALAFLAQVISLIVYPFPAYGAALSVVQPTIATNGADRPFFAVFLGVGQGRFDFHVAVGAEQH